MGSSTALVLLGDSPWGPGTNPTSTLHLVEGGRISWVLIPSEHNGRIVWDADPERLVDDLFALIGVHVLGHPVSAPLRVPRLCLPELDALDHVELDAAANRTRLESGGRMIVIPFHGSLLEDHLDAFNCLEHQDLEVLGTVRARWYMPFVGEWNSVGDFGDFGG